MKNNDKQTCDDVELSKHLSDNQIKGIKKSFKKTKRKQKRTRFKRSLELSENQS